MEDFLFHNISEDEKERIRKEAKKLIDSFSEKISKIKVSEEEPNVRRKEFERTEGNGEECDNDFKKIMFENAPNKNGDFILAEKKRWE
jgi:Asp-tRNA(Asn)/Glu-tRNA(Gln) amidotransferase C subunit